MNSVQAKDKIDIERKAREAEAYYSHGLLNESLELYEEILSSAPQLDSKRQKQLKEKIQLLKKEIEDLDSVKESLSSEEVSLFKATWEVEESVQDILGSISAFKELGLFTEAIEEYMKLFEQDYPVVNIMPDLVACFFEVNSPSRVIDQVDKIIEKNFTDAVFYAHIVRTTKDEVKRDISEVRLDIATAKTEDAKDHLDYLIF